MTNSTIPKTKPPFLCNDCGVDVLELGEWYMASKELWERRLGLGWSDNLCLGCLEQRLGRRVVVFSDIYPASSSPDDPWQPAVKVSNRMLERWRPSRRHTIRSRARPTRS